MTEEETECEGPSDEEWLAILEASKIDQGKRLESRNRVLGHPDAMDCAVYRFVASRDAGESEELCDGRILFIGKHNAPADIDEEEFEELYGCLDLELLVDAWIEWVFEQGKANIEPEPPDMVIVLPGAQVTLPYQLIDYKDTEEGRRCILLNCITDEWLSGASG